MQLETDEVRFRGEFRVTVPLSEIATATADAGTLVLEYPGGPLELELGDRAERWAHAVRHPKTVVEKLGVKPGQRVALHGVDAAEFRALLAEREVAVVDEQRDLDHLFAAAESAADLDAVAGLRAWLAPDGGLWLIRRKGRDAAVSEGEVRAAGRAAGLVDVKVVRFSDTHTADKFVIPRAERP